MSGFISGVVIFRFVTAVFLICSIVSCSNSQKEEITGAYLGIDPEVQDYTQPLKSDSFALDQNSDLFLNRIASLDREVFLQNRLYLFSRVGLKVAAVDTLGQVIRQIAQRGDGPGDIIVARSAKAWQSKSGDTYILSNGNAYSLYVFDAQGNYRYVIRLYSELEEMYHSVSGAYHISEKSDGKFWLTIAVNSTGSSPYKPGFYQEQPTLAQFVIDDYQQTVISKKTFWPYTDLPEVKKALVEDRMCWSGSEARFDIIDDKIYLTYPFLKKVLVLNKEFELQNTFELKSLRSFENGFCRSLAGEPPNNTYEQTYLQFHTYLSNFHIRDIQVLDNLLMVRFVAPLDEDEFLPKFPTANDVVDLGAYQGFFQSRDMYWLIVNMDNGKEEVIRLSPEHQQGIFLDKNRLLVEKTFPNSEERYLMKYTFDSPFGD